MSGLGCLVGNGGIEVRPSGRFVLSFGAVMLVPFQHFVSEFEVRSCWVFATQAEPIRRIQCSQQAVQTQAEGCSGLFSRPVPVTG
jgi:hypothetical protein